MSTSAPTDTPLKYAHLSFGVLRNVIKTNEDPNRVHLPGLPLHVVGTSSPAWASGPVQCMYIVYHTYAHLTPPPVRQTRAVDYAYHIDNT